MDNPYLQLTREFNAGATRAIICSGQAVVLHGLAVMSKDGDWILRENEETLSHVLEVLEARGARYRFGAPLALPWMRMGWSSHFELGWDGLRVRTDFFTRPPRLGLEELQALWQGQSGVTYPVTDLLTLARLKLTNRERDYAVIGEIARRLPLKEQLLWSRSVRDLIELTALHPELTRECLAERPLLSWAIEGHPEKLGEALDRERRRHMRANELRLEAMQSMMHRWREAWPTIQKRLANLSLLEAHAELKEAAAGLLPGE